MVISNEQAWNKIRQECTERGFNMADLAFLMHTTPANVCLINKMERKPTVEHLLLLADAWGMSLDDLIGRTIPEAEYPVKDKAWRDMRKKRSADERKARREARSM